MLLIITTTEENKCGWKNALTKGLAMDFPFDDAKALLRTARETSTSLLVFATAELNTIITAILLFFPFENPKTLEIIVYTKPDEIAELANKVHQWLQKFECGEVLGYLTITADEKVQSDTDFLAYLKNEDMRPIFETDNNVVVVRPDLFFTPPAFLKCIRIDTQVHIEGDELPSANPSSQAFRVHPLTEAPRDYFEPAPPAPPAPPVATSAPTDAPF